MIIIDKQGSKMHYKFFRNSMRLMISINFPSVLTSKELQNAGPSSNEFFILV